MGILAIVQAALEALIEFFKWQTVLSQIQSRKLVYDIDQQQKAAGRDLLAKIDAAKNDNDLSAVSLYLDDQADAAGFAADVRSALSDSTGRHDVGVSGGISKAATPVRESDNKDQSPGSGIAGPTLKHTVEASVIPDDDRFKVTGRATHFGLEVRLDGKPPDGEDDKGDEDKRGHPLLGAFGDVTHRKDIIGVAIPIKVFDDTIGVRNIHLVKSRQITVDIVSHVSGKHLTRAWIVDLGPSAKLDGKWLGRAADLTYLAAHLLQHEDGDVTYWINGVDGKPMEIDGWDRKEGHVMA